MAWACIILPAPGAASSTRRLPAKRAGRARPWHLYRSKDARTKKKWETYGNEGKKRAAHDCCSTCGRIRSIGFPPGSGSIANSCKPATQASRESVHHAVPASCYLVLLFPCTDSVWLALCREEIAVQQGPAAEGARQTDRRLRLLAEALSSREVQHCCKKKKNGARVCIRPVGLEKGNHWSLRATVHV